MASCLIKLTMCLNNRWILGQKFFSSAKFPGIFFTYISDEDFNQNPSSLEGLRGEGTLSACEQSLSKVSRPSPPETQPKGS